jgi:hypothetical protein
LLLLARRSTLPDRQKAVILACAFFVSICSIAYQFDDYHTPTDCVVLYSMLLLLLLQESTHLRRTMGLVASLGVLSGLAITLRINDGLALWFGVAISILCLAPARRFLSLVLFLVAAALTLIFVVHLTGDTFHDYATYSLFKAVGGKGGTGNVLYYPLKLPWNAFVFVTQYWAIGLIGYTFAIAGIWAYMLRPLGEPRGPGQLKKDAIGILLILLPLPFMYVRFINSNLVQVLSGLGVYVIYGLGVFVFLRYLRWEFSGRTIPWNSREILLITPLGQLISTAASSGGVHTGVYEPFAMFLIVLPIVSPIRIKLERNQAALIGVAAILTVSCALYRFIRPYEWHSTRSEFMFLGRQWYRHPVYGPMIIQTDMLHFIQPVCDQIDAGGSDGELLSIPYPYANYFCNIPPWHGYVQTYFDTSTDADIAGLMKQLQQSPPKWIFYERQLESLRAHERQYNHGQPLPHRYLDQFIEQKLADGEWHAVSSSTFEANFRWDNQWILIRTR